MEKEQENEREYGDRHYDTYKTPVFNKEIPKGFTDMKQSVLSLDSQRESFTRSPSNFDDHFKWYSKSNHEKPAGDKSPDGHCNCLVI